MSRDTRVSTLLVVLALVVVPPSSMMMFGAIQQEDVYGLWTYWYRWTNYSTTLYAPKCAESVLYPRSGVSIIWAHPKGKSFDVKERWYIEVAMTEGDINP